MELILLGVVSFVGVLLATLLAFVIRSSFILGGLERGNKEISDRLERGGKETRDRFERIEVRLDGFNDELGGIRERLVGIEGKLK